MSGAYLDLANGVSFPPRCPHCSEPPERTYRIEPRGGALALLFDSITPALVPVPVCAAAVRRRRRAGFFVTTALLLSICLAAFLSLTFWLNGHPGVGAVLLAATVFLLAVARLGKTDAWLDERILGVSAQRARHWGTAVRLTFRDDRYFSEWSVMNPKASMSGFVPDRRPAIEDRIGVPPGGAAQRGRMFSAMVLLVTLSVAGLHRWYLWRAAEITVTIFCLCCGMAVLAAAGVVHPPVLWSISDGMRQPRWLRILGWMLFLGGIGAGFVLAIRWRS